MTQSGETADTIAPVRLARETKGVGLGLYITRSLVRAQGGDPHGETGPPAAERAAGQVHLTLTGLPVPPDLPHQGEQFPDDELAVFDQAECAGRLAGHQHLVDGVKHNSGRGKH